MDLPKNENSIKYPESDEIEQEFARFLYEKHCAILVVEDLPVGSEFGIDMMTFRIGDKFKGVKLIPPGIHFVYASAIEGSTSSQHVGPRCGFFYDFKVRELVVKKWSVTEEDFDDSFTSNTEKQQVYHSNLRDLDRHLGVYTFSTYKTYCNLTDRLTPSIVESLMPTCKKIRAIPYLVRDQNLNTGESVDIQKISHRISTKDVVVEQNLLPDLKPDQSTVINFTKIPDNHKNSDQLISPEMITQYNLDTTMKLEFTFKDSIGRARLLAELQFSFITFLLCHIYDCFEQWKKILILICKAESGLKKFPSFYEDFIIILRCQLDQIPDDLFVDIVDSNNLIRTLLDTFFQNIDDSSPSRNLKKSSLELKSQVEERFGWQFDLGGEDEEPVIVET